MFLRTLPIVAHHLRPPLPLIPSSDVDSSSQSQAEDLAIASLAFLDTCFQRWTPDNEETIAALRPFLNTQITNLLRWMHHLYTTRVFHVNKRGSLCMFNTNPPIDVADSVPCILNKLIDYPDVLERTREDPHIGPLIGRMIVVAVRDDHYKSLIGSSVIRNSLAPTGLSGQERREQCQWEPDLLKILEDHAQVFAESLVSRLTQYSKQAPLITPNQFTVLLSAMADCIGDDTILNVCIEQDGLICAVMTAFGRTVDGIKAGKYQSLNTTGMPSDSSMLYCISFILKRSLAQGGPSLICLALAQGLYRDIFKLFSIQHFEDDMTAEETKSIDDNVAALVDVILPFLVYPSVLRHTKKFLDDPKSLWQDSVKSPKLEELDAALKRLASMYRYEVILRQSWLKDFQDATSAFSSPDKFCDNTHCPNTGKLSTLRRCTGCWYGYYCSRQCQSVVWNKEHREECKIIAHNNTVGKKEAFPLFLPIHQREYFRRTLVPRFKFWRESKAVLGDALDLTCKTIVYMDFTVFPFDISHFDDDELAVSGVPGLTIMANFPVTRRVGPVSAGMGLITVRNVPVCDE